jgi:hypothetical protein
MFLISWGISKELQDITETNVKIQHCIYLQTTYACTDLKNVTS